MDEKTVKDLVSLQKRFAKLYGSTSMMGVDNHTVQVGLEDFPYLIETYGDYRVTNIKKSYTGSLKEIHEWEISVMIKGVTFIAIGETEDFEDLGLPLPQPLEEGEE